ncbi:MAG TPA: hypothetical protein VMZ03_03835 [Chitinophagaceae bacterium]|nr:hypothetical protein [Chitinophagaceae bacterium]
MALKKETILKLAELTKTKPDELEKAIKEPAEVDFAIPDGIAPYTDAELQVLKNNEYANGKKAGVEMEIKEVKTKTGIDFPGKTITELVDFVTKKALEDAKITPDKKVLELEGQVKTLQNTITAQDKKLADKETEVAGVKINGELYKYIPQPGEEGPAFTPDEVIHNMNFNGYEFKKEEKGIVGYKGGVKLVDKLGEPVPVKDVVDGFLVEKKLIKAGGPQPGGRGGGDKPPGGAKAVKLSELKKQFTDQGKNLQGQEFSDAVNAAVKENKDFDMAS